MSVLERIDPKDATLPFLYVALDASAMGRVFERHFRLDDSVDISRCDIERVKYRPQRNCIIGYKLTVSDRDGTRERRLCVGMYSPEEARARFQKAIAGKFSASEFPAVSTISALNAVVWAFPNERKLSSLPLVTDPAQLREFVLPEVVRARWGDEWEIVDCKSRIANYFPEHSCSVNVALTLQNAGRKEHRTWQVIGKTRYDDAGAEAMAVMTTLCADFDKRVSYARPVLYQSDKRLLWQERVPGATLHSVLASGPINADVLGRVAAAIAALHGTRTHVMGRVTGQDLLDRLLVAKDVLSGASPTNADLLQEAVSELWERASSLDAEHECTWHGDLHSNNILVSPNHVYLIDLDGVCIGPPAGELGSFLAELIYRGCLNREPLDPLFTQLNSFVANYQRQVPWPIFAADIAWHTAGALIHERALRCVTSLKPGHTQLIKNLISTALRILRENPFAAEYRTSLKTKNQSTAAMYG